MNLAFSQISLSQILQDLYQQSKFSYGDNISGFVLELQEKVNMCITAMANIHSGLNMYQALSSVYMW